MNEDDRNKKKGGSERGRGSLHLGERGERQGEKRGKKWRREEEN